MSLSPLPRLSGPVTRPGAALAFALVLIVPSMSSWAAEGGAAGKVAEIAQAAKSTKAVKHRMVIQVTAEESKKWNSILGNVHNIQDELKADGGVAITVVAIGAGLGMLTADSLAANRVQDAMAEGVRFVACGNSMQAQQLTRDDLIAGVSVTKAGYVEIHRLQRQGWTYINP